MDGSPTAPAEAPDAALVEYLGGEVESEAPATEQQAPAEQAEQPQVQDAAQPRDQSGRFTKAEADAAVPETPAETPEAAPPEPAPSKPFSYRAYGAEHTPFANAVETAEGGVQFPPEAVPQLRQILAEGHNAESRRRQAEREREGKLTSARQSNATLVQQAELTLARLAELRRNPEALQNWFQDLDRNWAVLEAEVRADTLEKQLTARQQEIEQRAMEQQAETLRPYMRQTLEQHVGQMIAAEPELNGLDGKAMSERLWNAFFHRVFIEADQDTPQYKKGEILIDYDAIRAELQYEAKRSRPATPAVSKATPSIANKPPVAAPPVVPTKSAGARPAPKVPKFKSTQEADEWFEGGGYNDIA